jgi:hypothetical protein
VAQGPYLKSIFINFFHVAFPATLSQNNIEQFSPSRFTLPQTNDSSYVEGGEVAEGSGVDLFIFEFYAPLKIML